MGIKNSNRCQIAVIEGIFILFLVSSSFYLFLIDSDERYYSNTQNHDFLNSYISVIVENSSFRSLVINENLSSSNLNGNWSNFTNKFETDFDIDSYYLKISNLSSSKLIYNCTYNYGRVVVVDFISIENLTSYGFREINFGVCY